MKKTKIVATISDLRCDVEFIRPLVEAGVNVVRMNTAHMTKEGITQVINNTRTVSPSVAVLLDTKGPEVRTTVLEGDSEVKREFHAGDKVIFQANPEAKTNNEVINVNYVNFVHDVPVGARILLDDGALAFDVEKKEGDKLFTVCQNNGKLGSRKSSIANCSYYLSKRLDTHISSCKKSISCRHLRFICNYVASFINLCKSLYKACFRFIARKYKHTEGIVLYLVGGLFS